jgi:hypothetical protein
MLLHLPGGGRPASPVHVFVPTGEAFMKPASTKLRPSVVMSCLLAGACLGASASARADAFAQAILTIDNFRVLHSSAAAYGGRAYATTDFTTLSGRNVASASATLNDTVNAAPAKNVNFLNGALDIGQRFVGLPSPPRAENDFSPFPSPAPVPGTFGYADQYLSGTMITNGSNPAGVRTQSRADAALLEDGSAAGESNVGTTTNFKFDFMLSVADTMTFAFDATPFTQAYSTGNPHTSAIGRVTWTLNILDQFDNSVFMFAPSQLNALSNVNRSHDGAGLTTYAPGTLAFSATTAMLAANTQYRLTISQTSLANAVQETAVPEPASLAIFGLGLLGMSMLRRRR